MATSARLAGKGVRRHVTTVEKVDEKSKIHVRAKTPEGKLPIGLGVFKNGQLIGFFRFVFSNGAEKHYHDPTVNITFFRGNKKRKAPGCLGIMVNIIAQSGERNFPKCILTRRILCPTKLYGLG